MRMRCPLNQRNTDPGTFFGMLESAMRMRCPLNVSLASNRRVELNVRIRDADALSPQPSIVLASITGGVLLESAMRMRCPLNSSAELPPRRQPRC